MLIYLTVEVFRAHLIEKRRHNGRANNLCELKHYSVLYFHSLQQGEKADYTTKLEKKRYLGIACVVLLLVVTLDL